MADYAVGSLLGLLLAAGLDAGKTCLKKQARRISKV